MRSCESLFEMGVDAPGVGGMVMPSGAAADPEIGRTVASVLPLARRGKELTVWKGESQIRSVIGSSRFTRCSKGTSLRTRRTGLPRSASGYIGTVQIGRNSHIRGITSDCKLIETNNFAIDYTHCAG